MLIERQHFTFGVVISPQHAFQSIRTRQSIGKTKFACVVVVVVVIGGAAAATGATARCTGSISSSIRLRLEW